MTSDRGMGKKSKDRVERHIEKVFPEKPTDAEDACDNENENPEDEYIQDCDDDEEFIESECSDDESSTSDSEDYKNLKKKKTADGQKRSMGDILGQILGSTSELPQESPTTTTAPILSKRKAIERKLAEAKLDARARAALRRERLASRDAARCRTVDPAQLNREKTLRRAATQGVVQLFNAIHQVQVAREKQQKETVTEKKDKTEESNKKPAVLSKATFLDLLKSRGKK